MLAPVKAPIVARAHRAVLGIVYVVGIVAAILVIGAVTLAHAHSIARHPTPHPLWKTARYDINPTYADGLVLTQETSPSKEMVAHDVATGALRWQVINAELLGTDPTGSHIFYTYTFARSSIIKATTSDLAQQWSFSLPDMQGEASLELVTDTRCWVVGGSAHSSAATTYVLDARTGQKLSAYSLQDYPLAMSATTVYTRGTQAGTTSEVVSAFDAVTGNLRWTADGLSAGNWAAGDGELVGTQQDANSNNATVVALDEATSKQRWSFPLHTPYLYAPLVTANAIYVYASESPIYALDPASGRILWQSRDRIAVNSGNAPHLILQDDALYVGQEHAPLFALNATTGQVIWRSSISGIFFALDGPFLAVHGKNHYIVMLNERDGTVAWDWWDPYAGNFAFAAGNGRVVLATSVGLIAFNDEQ